MLPFGLFAQSNSYTVQPAGSGRQSLVMVDVRTIVVSSRLYRRGLIKISYHCKYQNVIGALARSGVFPPPGAKR